ncbi:MAG: hypothetical protein ABIH70_08105 [Chloroflexota bacterium]
MKKGQQIFNSRLTGLVEKIEKANWQNCDTKYMAGLVRERINELEQNGVACVDRFVKKLLDSCDVGKEAYWDILMEGRFAIILARNNFSDIEIEYAERGPDLKARWNRKTVYFEVTRKHPSEDDKLFSHPGAGAYWVKPAESEDIIGKIQGKLPQLKPDGINIVVLWSDTPAWSQRVLGKAHKYIKQKICGDPNRHKDLSAILFTPGGFVNGATLKQFYLFENDKASKPLGPRLVNKLESLHEKNPKQLKREFEELAASFKQLVDKRNS